MKHRYLATTVKCTIALTIVVLALVSTPTWASALALLAAISYLYFKLIQTGQFNYLPMAEGAALRAQLDRQIRSS